MEPDDALPRTLSGLGAGLGSGLASGPGDLLSDLVREDLDPLSVAELEGRITALEGEIARCRLKMERAISHRASADGLFKS